MTAAGYLSLPNNGYSGNYAHALLPVGPTMNPFGVTVDPYGNTISATDYQNLDAQVYFTASTYVPPGVTTQDVPPRTIGTQSLFDAYNWRIAIELDGTASFAGDITPGVRSTVRIPTASLSPKGLYLRVYVNAYGGSPNYPGASTAPCVVFFTSPDEGATFVQFGDPVPLPPRTVPLDPEVEAINPYGKLPHGPYIGLTYCPFAYTSSVAVGSYWNLPDMRVYKWSIQDSTGRYLFDFDFTTLDPTVPYTVEPYTVSGASLVRPEP